MDFAFFVACQPHQFQQPIDLPSDQVAGLPLHPQPKAHVPENIHLREEGQVLEHQTESPKMGSNSFLVLPVEQNGSRIQGLQAGDQP